MPSAEIRRPPHQHSAETTPARLGPTFSSHPPQMAAEQTEKHEEKRVHPAKIGDAPVAGAREQRVMSVMSGHLTEWSMPIAWLSGSQNTLKP